MPKPKRKRLDYCIRRVPLGLGMDAIIEVIYLGADGSVAQHPSHKSQWDEELDAVGGLGRVYLPIGNPNLPYEGSVCGENLGAWWGHSPCYEDMIKALKGIGVTQDEHLSIRYREERHKDKTHRRAMEKALQWCLDNVEEARQIVARREARMAQRMEVLRKAEEDCLMDDPSPTAAAEDAPERVLRLENGGAP